MATRGSPNVGPNDGTGLPAAMVGRIVDLYVDGGFSTYRIAQEIGIDRQRVTRILHRAGVPISPKGRNRARPPRVDDDPTEQELRRLYVEERLTTPAIGRLLGIPDRRVRERLARYGIERRHRGAWDRRDRIEVAPDDIDDLYVRKELPADEVGNHLGVSLRIVLRSAHSHGFAVRPGGAPSLSTPDIQLIEALYGDPEVRRVLRSHLVPVVTVPGLLWERFPRPVPLTASLLKDLYLGCGLSSFQIEMVTGQPSMTILRKLAQADVERRPRGGLSPFMQRWRGQHTSRQSR
jgi:transposase-like protein